jgi:hypothetical protein
MRDDEVCGGCAEELVVLASGLAPGLGGRGGFGGNGARGGSGNVVGPFKTLNSGYVAFSKDVVVDGREGNLLRAEDRVTGSRRDWKAVDMGWSVEEKVRLVLSLSCIRRPVSRRRLGYVPMHGSAKT